LLLTPTDCIWKLILLFAQADSAQIVYPMIEGWKTIYSFKALSKGTSKLTFEYL